MDPSPTVTASPASGSVFPIGVTTVTVTAYDTALNTNTCTFTVSVQDTTAPTIVCPSNQVVVCSGTNAIATFTPTATDAADASPTVTASPASGTSFPVGTNTVTVTASDSHGNTNTCTFLVIVEDPALITLTIVQSGTNVVITWPQTCRTYTLEGTSGLEPVISWSPVGAPVNVDGSNFTVTLPATDSKQFFRLRSP